MKFRKVELKHRKRAVHKLTEAKKEAIAVSIWANHGKKIKSIAGEHEVSDTTVHLILHEYFEWILVQKKYVEK